MSRSAARASDHLELQSEFFAEPALRFEEAVEKQQDNVYYLYTDRDDTLPEPESMSETEQPDSDNEEGRITAPDDLSDENKLEEQSYLAGIWDRADQVVQSSKGGRPTEGHVKRAETRIRLEPANVKWLKKKGPNHLSRINGLLTALREEEEGMSPSLD